MPQSSTYLPLDALDGERVRVALAAGAIIGTWFWDVKADAVTVDPALERAFGLDPSGGRRTLQDLIRSVHPEDQTSLDAAIQDAISRGGQYVHQYRTRHGDDAWRWVEARGWVNLDASGAAISFPGVLIDISERRRVEEARDRAEGLLNTFVEAVPGVVYAKDRQGRLLIGNRGTTNLIGRPPEEYLGRTDAELLDNQIQAAAVMAADARIMASGQMEQLEEEVNYPNGKRAFWLSTKAPLRDANGQIVGLIGASLDITDRKAVEASHREIEERYRLAALATSDAIWDWRMADGHVIWNEALATLFGHDRLESSAQWWLDNIHPDDRERIGDSIHAVIDHGGDVWSAEYRFRRADGAYADILDRGTVLRGSAGEPIRMIGAMLDLTGRKAAQAALTESEERLRLATEASDIGFWDVDLVNDLLIWPARTKAMFGISPHVPCSMADFYAGLHPEDLEKTSVAFAAAADPAQRALYDVEYRTVGKEDGVTRWVAAKGRGLFERDRCTRVVGVAIDVTARKAAETQLRELNERLESRVAEEVAERIRVEDALRQSQKMEAVGQLTGGIAHDFNNMLAAIIGPLDLLTGRLDPEDARAKRYVDIAMEAARRAAQLTQRLLAFSRQQPLQPESLDANKLVAGMSDLLSHSLGGDVRLETVLAGGLWRTHADPNQLENVILNLAVNARDAMPEGGRVTVETANCYLDHGYAEGNLGVAPGQYVLIAVSDTGAGMPAEVIAKAFDPFFTTKEVGRGTGLGLSQVYGFVKQSGGHVKIYSEIGSGTTVKVYLPRQVGADVGTDVVTIAHPLPRGELQEVILVVEDELAVRQFSVDALTELGYHVFSADSAAAALRILEEEPSISLMFTDVVMPETNGRKLADEACRRWPHLKVLFTTGYSRNAVVHNGVLDPGVNLIGKPFTLQELAARVRDVLEK
ncbi:PAS domain S-box-containing protein [Pseudoxanthomonas sp. CF385]|uniref:PAS domain-containing hybrid sensor histidine kinase/response regulator n=1 Tax=Pseudoxanthomonas sp. CF385 TaxID=1881042 RepID=UPI00087EEF21|nr:PAS domain-containing protein [Pseudoxanthomonas sp. CF385]SDQ82923.1 PAS domain S-box-containing protein [Pseudoxanthomonas sp. CF385]